MVMYLENTLQASGDMQQGFIPPCVDNFVVKYFPDTNTDHLLSTQKNLRGTWREELLWIEHWLELRKGICQHLHDNLHPTNTSNVFSTLTPKSHAIHPTNGQCHHMAKALSMQKYQTTPHFLMKNSSKTYKARSGHYCTNHEHLIQKCYLL